MKKSFLILILPFLLASCHKDDHNDSYTYITLTPCLLTQAFNKGSYWIYRNDSTQKTDCTYVRNVVHGSYEQYWGLGAFTYTEYFEILYCRSNAINGYPVDRDWLEANVIYYNPVPGYNMGVTGPVIYSCRLDSLTQHYDSIMAGNTVFYKVQKSTVGTSTFYVAQSIGLVKKIIRDSTDQGTWNLIRWKVVR